MNKRSIKTILGLGVIGLVSFLFNPPDANALPAFARQTGLPCSACHNGNFPALTPFGRQFKLDGYVMTAIKRVTQTGTKQNPAQLSLISIPQMSGMLQLSATHTKKGQAGQQNNDVQFPDQMSMFFAGELTSNAGMFLQITHAQGDPGFTMDNVDIRAADSTNLGSHHLTYGLDVNNSPTVEDLWNSTPTWGFPWASSPTANDVSTGAFIDQGPDTNAAGVGGYAMLDNTYYADFALYRSAFINGSAGSTNTIKNAAPYWRLAWQHNFGSSYLMVGTYGMYAKVFPSPVATGNGIAGPTGTYFDRAVDFQYEMPLAGDDNSMILHGSYTNEGRTNIAPDGTYQDGNNPTYGFSKFDAVFNIASRWRPIVAWFHTNTGNDNLDNNGYIAQVNFFPWENLNLAVQYKAFTKFDGTTSGASDNNSLYLLGWLVL